MHNTELADVLGNLVQRVLVLCHKYCAGVVPDARHDPGFALPFDLTLLIEDVRAAAATCSINVALFKAMEAARATNRFLTESEPWKMKGADEARRPSIVRTTLEALYAFSHFLAPVMPFAAQEVFEKLGSPPRAAFLLSGDFYNLTPGTSVQLGDILFKKIVVPDVELLSSSPTAAAATAAAAVSAELGGANGGKVGAKKGGGGGGASKKAEEFVEDPTQVRG